MKISLYMFLIYLCRHYQYWNNLANPSMVNFIQIKKKNWNYIINFRTHEISLKTTYNQTGNLDYKYYMKHRAIFKKLFVCHLPNEEKVPHSVFSFTIWAQFFICLWSITTVTNFYSCAKIFHKVPESLIVANISCLKPVFVVW